MFGHRRGGKRSILIVCGVAFVGVLIGIALLLPGLLQCSGAYSDNVRGCIVTDGDMIRCGREVIRLVGIDAPESREHCESNRGCAPGEPFVSTADLRNARSAELHIQRVGRDRYGRTLALVTRAQRVRSCWQLT
jgi:micrococcal nuclease